MTVGENGYVRLVDEGVRRSDLTGGKFLDKSTEEESSGSPSIEAFVAAPFESRRVSASAYELSWGRDRALCDREPRSVVLRSCFGGEKEPAGARQHCGKSGIMMRATINLRLKPRPTLLDGASTTSLKYDQTNPAGPQGSRCNEAGSSRSINEGGDGLSKSNRPALLIQRLNSSTSRSVCKYGRRPKQSEPIARGKPELYIPQCA